MYPSAADSMPRLRLSVVNPDRSLNRNSPLQHPVTVCSTPCHYPVRFNDLYTPARRVAFDYSRSTFVICKHHAKKKPKKATREQITIQRTFVSDGCRGTL